MPNYEKMYYRLFNAATNAVEALAENNYGKAKEILIEAQRAAEEAYLNAEEET